MQLYRHYDRDGTLLYVGISLHHLERLHDHQNNAHWFRSIATITVQHYSTRRAAMAAEWVAIRDEKPLYNISRPERVPRPHEPVPTSSVPLHRLRVNAATAPLQAGRYADGGGLYLVVDASGARRWAFVFKSGGRKREMGLGPVQHVSLRIAREAAATIRQMVCAGKDPIQWRRETFRDGQKWPA